MISAALKIVCFALVFQGYLSAPTNEANPQDVLPENIENDDLSSESHSLALLDKLETGPETQITAPQPGEEQIEPELSNETEENNAEGNDENNAEGNDENNADNITYETRGLKEIVEAAKETSRLFASQNGAVLPSSAHLKHQAQAPAGLSKLRYDLTKTSH